MTAADEVGQMKQVWETVLDGRRGQHQPERGIDLTDARADDGVIALDLGAFVNDARTERILAQVGERRGIDAFNLVVSHHASLADAALKLAVPRDDQFGTDELLLFGGE